MREAVLSVGDGEIASLGVEDLLETCRAAGIRDFEELECRGAGAVVQVAVDSPIDGDRLDASESVDWWEAVSSSDDAFRYVVSFTAPELADEAAEHADRMVGTCDPELDEQGATMSFVGPQEAIRGTVDAYETAGASPDLRRLGAYRGGGDPLDDLTARQREVIRTAFDAGYYEVPREASTDDVADELDLDPSTVAEHLQRAERNLLGRVLGGES